MLQHFQTSLLALPGLVVRMMVVTDPRAVLDFNYYNGSNTSQKEISNFRRSICITVGPKPQPSCKPCADDGQMPQCITYIAPLMQLTSKLSCNENMLVWIRGPRYYDPTQTTPTLYRPEAATYRAVTHAKAPPFSQWQGTQ
jgi:hypothetical protein